MVFPIHGGYGGEAPSRLSDRVPRHGGAHPQNRQDAIFGHVAKILSRADSLQTPEDFAEKVRTKCIGYHVEHINGVLPWKQWLQTLPALSGINQTKWASDRGEEFQAGSKGRLTSAYGSIPSSF